MRDKRNNNPSENVSRNRSVDRGNQSLYLYGLHTVRAAIANPERLKTRLYVTPNALKRLEVEESELANLEIVESYPQQLDKLVGQGAVHQGCVLEAAVLEPKPLSALGLRDLILVLDQVTDPHNVGAIMRSAVAMGCSALITTNRHSPQETGVLAKAASGAVDLIDHIEVRNLSEALIELHNLGFETIGLDSEGPMTMDRSVGAEKIAIVLGAEGKGLRKKTRETCTRLARIDMPGSIKSLNVSNAAVLALYIARERIAASAHIAV